MPTPTTWGTGSSAPLSGNALTDSLIFGTKWGAAVGTGASVTYSFPGSASSWSSDRSTGYGSPSTQQPWVSLAPLSLNEQAAFVSALQAWANVANLSFVQTADTAATVGDIRVAFSGAFSSPNVLASTYLPRPSATAGDVWLNIDDRQTLLSDLSPGSLGFHTLVHELGHALGLKHPFAGAGISSATLPPEFDSLSYTQMSYSEKPGLFDDGGMSIYPTTPMRFDIAAVQYLYGPNLSYHAGNDIYTFSDTGKYFQTIWDAGGNDTIQYNATTPGLIDLRPDQWSALGQPIRYSDGTLRPLTVAIYSTVTIENAIGGNGSDTLIGNGAANYLSGGFGNDLLIGVAGDDALDGGPGIDTASYNGARSAYAVAWRDGVTVSSTADGTDHLVDVEAVQFADMTGHITNRPLEYIASYPDLIAAFGANAAAGFDHFLNSGYSEGRTVTFDGLEYIASYGDLMNVLGANEDAGAPSYITNGRFEGRHITFDGLEYIASYSDLISAFGADADAGASHYIQTGRFEGRQSTFDGLEYIASYVDLINAFHSQEAADPNPDIGATHYIDAGYAEHRAPGLFEPAQYLANYPDLQAAFGADTEAAILHYITHGYFEGRTDHLLT
jgi:serralysin